MSEKKPDFIEYSNNFEEDGQLTENSKKRASSSIGGTTRKRFVRFRSDAFKNLFKAMEDENCSIVTYFDELFKSGYRREDGTPLEYISAMLKHTRRGTNKEMEVEALTSKLLNYFNLPTVYNEIFYLDDRPRTLSVDFLKLGETIIPLSRGDASLEDDPVEQWDDCSKWDNRLRKAVNNVVGNVSCREQVVENIMQEIFKNYLYRGILLGDYDYSSRNIMLVYNSLKNQYSLAPNLDFEMALTPVDYEKFIKIYGPKLDFIKEKYPDMFNEFLNNISNIKKDRNLIKLINASVKDEKDRFKYYYLLKNNARLILENYSTPNAYSVGKTKQGAQDFNQVNNITKNP